MAIHVEYELEAHELPRGCVRDCSASGDVSTPVFVWREALGFTVDRARATDYLEGCGAWEREELDATTDAVLAERVLWLACCQFNEGETLFILE